MVHFSFKMLAKTLEQGENMQRFARFEAHPRRLPRRGNTFHLHNEARTKTEVCVCHCAQRWCSAELSIGGIGVWGHVDQFWNNMCCYGMEGSGWKGPAIFLLPHDKKFEFNVKTMQCFQVPKSQDSDGFWQGSSQIPDPRDSQGLLKTGCPAAWLTACTMRGREHSGNSSKDQLPHSPCISTNHSISPSG